MRLETHVVDLLLSRLLHDLIGPASATSNGIELLEEFGSRANDPIATEALELIGESARQSADRLSYFRLAFGGAGNSDEHTLAVARRLAEAYLLSRKFALDFDSEVDETALAPPGIVKSLLAALFLMADALPRHGRVAIRVGPDWSVSITSQGPGAMIEADSIIGLEDGGAVDGLNTRTVIGVMVGHTARRFGLDIDVHGETDLARVTLRPNAV